MLPLLFKGPWSHSFGSSTLPSCFGGNIAHLRMSRLVLHLPNPEITATENTRQYYRLLEITKRLLESTRDYQEITGDY